MLILTALLLAAATPRIADQAGPRVLIGGPTIARAFAYGPQPRQGLTLYTRGRVPAPVIVYVHGGGWTAGGPGAGSGGAQPDHFTRRGYAYATAAHRYVPIVTVEQQLDDLARAIASLRRQPGIDRDRIVLIGHSSGAHLAALLGTDPAYLERAGVPFAALRAVVLLDPAVLDVPPVLAGPPNPTILRHFLPAFGADPVRQSALSPIKQSAPPNAPSWAILTDAANGFAVAQGAEFAAALLGAGAREAAIAPIAGTTHARLNDAIGAPGDSATALIDAFLARALPQSRRPRLR